MDYGQGWERIFAGMQKRRFNVTSINVISLNSQQPEGFHDIFCFESYKQTSYYFLNLREIQSKIMNQINNIYRTFF